MDGQVGLAIAIQIEPSQRDPAFDGTLVNPSRDTPSVPHDLARQTGVHRHDPHWALIRCSPVTRAGATAACSSLLFAAPCSRRTRGPTGGFNAELLCVLGVQSLPATELHGLGADEP